jgi:hypothetical protein
MILKAETDGDIRIALQNATGDKPGIVPIEPRKLLSGFSPERFKRSLGKLISCQMPEHLP